MNRCSDEIIVNHANIILKRAGKISQVNYRNGVPPIFGAVTISRSSKIKLDVVFPVKAEELTHVIVNGVTFYKKGAVKEIIKVAPLIYKDSDFREVNWHVENKHYSKEAALKDIAEQHGYDFGNFRRAYYDRKGSKMGSEPNLTVSEASRITSKKVND